MSVTVALGGGKLVADVQEGSWRRACRWLQLFLRHRGEVRVDKCKRRRRAKTTDSNHEFPTYPNLVKDIIPIRPNQVWVSDITYMVIYVEGKSGEYRFCYPRSSPITIQRRLWAGVSARH